MNFKIVTTLICFLVLWKCLCRVMGKKGSFRRKEEITCIYFYTYSVYVCTNVYKHIYIYVACLLSRVQLFATPWTVAHQVPPSMGFSRQEYWSGVPLPTPLLWSATYKNASFLTDLWLECVVKLLSFC